MEMYRYTGDIKKLIPSGWKFQKLYANDYKTYTKDDIIMFVVSKMVLEISNIKNRTGEQKALIDFILLNKDQPDSFWESPYTSPAMIKLFGHGTRPNFVVHTGKVRTYEEVMRMKAEFFKEYDKDESTPYVPDGVLIDLELVKSIIELDNLGGLELYEKARKKSRRSTQSPT